MLVTHENRQQRPYRATSSVIRTSAPPSHRSTGKINHFCRHGADLDNKSRRTAWPESIVAALSGHIVDRRAYSVAHGEGMIFGRSAHSVGCRFGHPRIHGRSRLMTTDIIRNVDVAPVTKQGRLKRQPCQLVCVCDLVFGHNDSVEHITQDTLHGHRVTTITARLEKPQSHCHDRSPSLAKFTV